MGPKTKKSKLWLNAETYDKEYILFQPLTEELSTISDYIIGINILQKYWNSITVLLIISLRLHFDWTVPQ